MTESLQKLLEFLRYLLTWWFLVEPWERAIRVRLGKRVHLYGPGLHFRFPYFDQVYAHNTRRMVCMGAAQTISSSDGKVFVIALSVSYEIVDVLKLHTSVHDAEAVMSQHMAQKVAEFVTARASAEVQPEAMQKFIESTLDVTGFGLGNINVCVSNFASVRTFRIISDSLVYWRDADSLMSTSRKR